MDLYDGDSFFTLTGPARAGLLLLTAVLSLSMIWLATRVRVYWVPVLFWAFVWVSPQVYYAYYWFIFDGLPIQIVIKSPPFLEALQLVTFTFENSLSAHGKGVLFWAMMAASVLANRRRRT